MKYYTSKSIWVSEIDFDGFEKNRQNVEWVRKGKWIWEELGDEYDQIMYKTLKKTNKNVKN